MRSQLLFIVLLGLFFQACQPAGPTVVTYQGETMGTTYNISIPNQHTDINQLKTATDDLLTEVNASMSTYIDSSLISKINAETDTFRTHYIDAHFETVFRKAKQVHDQSDGAFNPALGPLISAWGFGAQEKAEVSQDDVDSLLQLVDFDAFQLTRARLKKQISHAKLDFSAIAKGYGVDVVANLLSVAGITSYFVEIGGEVRTQGQHPAGRPWRTGIDKPVEGNSAGREIQIAIELSNQALATSGNYRNFYVRNGKKYVHTINPETGYPEENDLLGASVIANDCMTADAFATAFMVMGKDKALALAEKLGDIEAYFISSDEAGNFVESRTSGFPPALSLPNN